MAQEISNLVKATFEEINKRVEKRDFEHIYVVDTNIIHDFPEAIGILAHEDRELTDNEKPNVVVISDVVRRELNGLKKSENIDKAIGARRALAGINNYWKKNRTIGLGEYNFGVEFKNGSLMVDLPYDEIKFPKLREDFRGDDQIVSSTMALRKAVEKKGDIISVVSDDADMDTSCKQFKVPCSKFEEFYKDYDYSGFIDIDVDEFMVHNKTMKNAINIHSRLVESKEIPLDLIRELLDDNAIIYPNQFVHFEGKEINPKYSYLRIDQQENKAVRLRNYQNFLIERKNSEGFKLEYVPTPEQECALELMCDPDIDYVTLSGPPGGGKTMLPLSIGLFKLYNKDIYSMLISNPPIDSTHGFLPGSKKDKLFEENRNIIDNLFYLMGVNKESKEDKEKVEEKIMTMISKGEIELEALTYIKGRTLHNRWIVFTEVEDYEPKQMRKLASRLGLGSKMVFEGDPYQVDNFRCSKTRNGLVYMISRLKNNPIFGHVTLRNVERSRGAKTAAKYL